MAGKGGGAWKVAYADFVTAMMAFFMVMWLVGQSKPVKESVANYFKDPSGISILPGKSTSLIPMKEGGASPLGKGPVRATSAKSTTEAGGIQGDDNDSRSTRSSRIAMGENSTVGTQIPFSEEAAELDERGRQALDQLTPVLAGKLCKIEIRGHASRRPASPDSPFADPWELSYARSKSVMKYLLEKGIDPRCIRLSQSGANEPNLLVNHATDRVQNARVEVFVLNEFVTDPSEVKQRRNDRLKKFNPKKPRPNVATITPKVAGEAEHKSDEKKHAE